MKENRTIIFGGGCFWGIEHSFSKVEGVQRSTSGYSGGHKENPSYEEVCSGNTGHAEVVEVEYDPDKVSLEKLLNIFFEIHDPTTLNRQGPDIGTQYRSAVYYSSEEEKEAVANFIKEKQTSLGKEIVTELKPATKFWKAEEYHQCYFQKRGES